MDLLDNNKIKFLVLNWYKEDWVGSEPTVASIRADHINNNKWEDIGYHFVIKGDGTIEQGRSLLYSGKHTLKVDSISLGVLILSSPSNSITNKQKKAIVDLSLDIANDVYGSFPNFNPVHLKCNNDFRVDENPSIEINEAIADFRRDIKNNYTNPDPNDKEKKNIKKEYEKREIDGKDYYNDFRSRLYILYKNGDITALQAFEVEDHLKDVVESLITGNWLSAQSQLTGKTLLGVFDQDLKDEVMTGINAYLAENY